MNGCDHGFCHVVQIDIIIWVRKGIDIQGQISFLFDVHERVE